MAMDRKLEERPPGRVSWFVALLIIASIVGFVVVAPVAFVVGVWAIWGWPYGTLAVALVGVVFFFLVFRGSRP